MDKIVFALPGNEELADNIVDHLECTKGKYHFHKFPDEESYIRLESDVSGKKLLLSVH